MRLILFLCFILLSSLGVSAADCDEYVFDEPIRLSEEVFENAGDFEEDGRFTLQLVRHMTDRGEIEEIIVSGKPFMSPLFTQLTDNGSLGYELIRTPGESGTKTVSGLSKSYRILCNIEVSLHFMFYKGRHVCSASSAQVEEIHKKYEVFAVGGGKTDSEITKDTRNPILYSENFDSRIERAAEIGYNTKKPEHSFIKEYKVCDDSGNYVCTMDAAHPEVKKMNVFSVIGFVGGLTGLTLMAVTAYRRHKKA